MRAFSPYGRAKWSQQWAEEKAANLSGRIKRIAKEHEAAAAVISALVEAGERQAEIERQRWEVQRREQARQEAEHTALKDSREQWLAIVDKWALAREIEIFFEDATRSAKELSGDQAATLLARLEGARRLLGGIDPIRHFDAWLSPEDRVPNAAEDGD